MVGLKTKIKASTLMETIVATVIILGVFMVASLVLNNMFKNVVENDTTALENRMEYLSYLNEHKIIELPYEETFTPYEIYMFKEENEGVSYVKIEATHSSKNKIISQYYASK